MDLKNPKKGDRICGFVKHYRKYPDTRLRDDLLLKSGRVLMVDLMSRVWRDKIQEGDLLVLECVRPQLKRGFVYGEYAEYTILPGTWKPVFK